MLSCVVSTAPMEVLAGGAVGGVRLYELLTFINYLGPVINSSHLPPRACGTKPGER
jgi:hypothetical protein